MTLQMTLFDEQMPFQEDMHYTASQITDKIKCITKINLFMLSTIHKQQ